MGSKGNKITLGKGDLVRLAICPKGLGKVRMMKLNNLIMRLRMKLNNLIVRLRMKGISGKSLPLVFKCILKSRLCVLRICTIIFLAYHIAHMCTLVLAF